MTWRRCIEISCNHCSQIKMLLFSCRFQAQSCPRNVQDPEDFQSLLFQCMHVLRSGCVVLEVWRRRRCGGGSGDVLARSHHPTQLKGNADIRTSKASAQDRYHDIAPPTVVLQKKQGGNLHAMLQTHGGQMRDGLSFGPYIRTWRNGLSLGHLIHVGRNLNFIMSIVRSETR